MVNKILNERSLRILKALVEQYITDGQPVGSKTIAKSTKLSLSSASIRNIMADLETAGYLISPHASAGRVPTNRGYRLFVDSLLTVKPFTSPQIDDFRQQLNDKRKNQQALVENASSMLSALTNFAGLVTVPRRECATLRHVEFLPLSGQRVLVVLVLNEQEVQNRVIYTKKAYSESELRAVGNYLTQHFAGRDLHEIHDLVVASMQDDKANLQNMMQAVIEMTEQMVDDEQTDEDYVIAGQANLLAMSEEADINKLRGLFEAFAKKRDILHLLDQSVAEEGVHIFIGDESGYDVLDQYSVVTAPYRAGKNVIGMLGVIGPTRMAYDRVISAVDVTAKLLSVAMNDKSVEEL